MRRLAIVGAAAAMAVATVPVAAGAETGAARRASAAECAAWQAKSNRLTVRLNALGRAKLHGRRAYAASRLVGRLSGELSGYRGLLVVGCLPLPPLPGQPAGAGPVLSTIPAALLENLTFTPPQGDPAISQAEAERIAGGGIVRGSQLAHCSYPVGVYAFDRDCWIVSLPGGAVSSGPVGSPRSVSVYHVTLLDAQTGAFLIGAEG
jgi:hypothetical protein